MSNIRRWDKKPDWKILEKGEEYSESDAGKGPHEIEGLMWKMRWLDEEILSVSDALKKANDQDIKDIWWELTEEWGGSSGERIAKNDTDFFQNVVSIA